MTDNDTKIKVKLLECDTISQAKLKIMDAVYSDQPVSQRPHITVSKQTNKQTNKNIKLQPVPPSMPSESLSVRLSGINSTSNGIDGVTDCNFIFFSRYNTNTSTNL